MLAAREARVGTKNDKEAKLAGKDEREAGLDVTSAQIVCVKVVSSDC